MTADVQRETQKRDRKQQQAQRRIEVFQSQFEEPYRSQVFDLALHAAFPLTLTTDLVYCLRENFVPHAPWYASPDILLSGLCESVGHDLYEMAAATKVALLRQLIECHTKQRLDALADFMGAYIHHQICMGQRNRGLDVGEPGEPMRWTALSLLAPGTLYDQIREYLQQRLQQEKNLEDCLRWASLVETYADMLPTDFWQEYRPLLLDLADQTAAGHVVENGAMTLAQTLGVSLKPLEISVVTVVSAANAEEDSSDRILEKAVETVTLSEEGQEIRRDTHKVFYYIEDYIEPIEALPDEAASQEEPMEREQAEALLDDLERYLYELDGKEMPNGQRAVLQACLRNSNPPSYNDMSGYLGGEGYGLYQSTTLKNEGYLIFKRLTNVLEKDVSKKNCRRRLLEWYAARHGTSASPPPSLEVTEPIPLTMIGIPSGEFWMGTDKADPEYKHDDESPKHQVTVPPFWMSQYPITQAQWRSVAVLPQVDRQLNPNPSRFEGADRPVEQVSWDDAVEFCRRLSQHTGRSYRLPSEAEWEYACRAGTTTAYHVGPTITKAVANYDGSETTPVNQFGLANAFGLCEMHGNVWEWCADPWHLNYDGAPMDGSVWNQDTESDSRVLRGGSWLFNSDYCRSAYRNLNLRGNRYGDFGFRVVVSAPGLRSS